MIDGFSGIVYDVDLNFFEKHFIIKKILYDDEIKKTFATHKGLHLTLNATNNQLRINGSIHIFNNNGIHNHNDFALSDIRIALKKLEKEIGINPKDIIITKLESGINIPPPIKTSSLIRYCFSFSRKPFKNRIITGKEKSNIKELSLQHNTIKVYDKGLQDKLPYDLIRFENKFKHKRQINTEFCIYTLNDIQDPEKIKKLRDKLLKIWMNILFYDPTIRKEELSKHNQCKIKDLQNPYFWEELTENNSYRSQWTYYKGVLQNIIKKHSDKIQEKTSKLIIDKFEFLLNN